LRSSIIEEGENIMKRVLFRIGLLSVISIIMIPTVTLAAAPFYQGKVVRIIVGQAPGSSIDLHTRVIIKHMGKYIQGNPTIIVENMTGAGSLISANYLYNVAKPDGLTIGQFMGGLFYNQALGQPGIKFDARKFEYMGAALHTKLVCYFTKASGITSLEKWLASKVPVKMGGQAPGNVVDACTEILQVACDLPIKIVSGYSGGTPETLLAVESGELDGTLVNWETIKATKMRAVEKGDAFVVLQTAPNVIPDIPKVPQAINAAKTDLGRKLIEVGIYSGSVISRPYFLPPGTPKDRVEILRNALQQTLRDKGFLTDLEKTRMSVDPTTAEEVKKAVDRIFDTDPAMAKKLKEIFVK
jgi:tripartite-type tricarboxylate transporter receptor subunit TctC